MKTLLILNLVTVVVFGRIFIGECPEERPIDKYVDGDASKYVFDGKMYLLSNDIWSDGTWDSIMDCVVVEAKVDSVNPNSFKLHFSMWHRLAWSWYTYI